MTTPPSPNRSLTREQAIRQARQDRTPRGRRPWPFPEDRNALDRARRLAHGLHDALEKADPAAAATIREQAHRYGETWLRPSRPDHTAGRRLTADEAAEIAGVRPKTIRSWTSRGLRWGGEQHYLIRHPDGYDEAELLAFDAARRGAYPTTEEAA